MIPGSAFAAVVIVFVTVLPVTCTAVRLYTGFGTLNRIHSFCTTNPDTKISNAKRVRGMYLRLPNLNQYLLDASNTVSVLF